MQDGDSDENFNWDSEDDREIDNSTLVNPNGVARVSSVVVNARSLSQIWFACFGDYQGEANVIIANCYVYCL